jgi:hypothetical protein
VHLCTPAISTKAEITAFPDPTAVAVVVYGDEESDEGEIDTTFVSEEVNLTFEIVPLDVVTFTPKVPYSPGTKVDDAGIKLTEQLGVVDAPPLQTQLPFDPPFLHEAPPEHPPPQLHMYFPSLYHSLVFLHELPPPPPPLQAFRAEAG